MEEIFIKIFDPSNQMYQLLISLFLGIFIGLRREMLFQKKGFEGIMGIRTISIFTILGTVSTFFSGLVYLPVIIFAGIFGFLLVAYYNGVFNLKKIGLTSELSALTMYWVGVLVGEEKFLLAVFLTAIIGIFTAYKKDFHTFAKNFSLKEWSGTLQLIIVSAIILPLLPRDKSIDPWGVIIPFDIWLLVIFILAIGFVGYFFDKYFSKKKSILMTASLGSLISSTAMTISLAYKSKKTKISTNLLAVGLMFSVAVMQFRVLATILILSGSLTLSFLLPSFFMAITALGGAYYFWLKYSQQNKQKDLPSVEMQIKSPFQLWPAIKFGLLFIFILFAIYFAEEKFNNLGGYIVAFVASFADADSVILTALENFKKGEGIFYVSFLILIPIIVNTLVKSFYIYLLGSRKLFYKTLLPILVISAVGGLVFLFLF